MKNELERALYKVAAMTFEELGFMLPVIELTDEQATAPPQVAVEVWFHGPFEGRLVLQLCGEITSAITSNMLASENLPPEHLQRDAVGEVVNVICGNLLPAIFGAKEIFHIDAPHAVEHRSREEWFSTMPSGEAHIGIEEGRADLFLYIDNKAIN